MTANMAANEAANICPHVFGPLHVQCQKPVHHRRYSCTASGKTDDGIHWVAFWWPTPVPDDTFDLDEWQRTTPTGVSPPDTPTDFTSCPPDGRRQNEGSGSPSSADPPS